MTPKLYDSIVLTLLLARFASTALAQASDGGVFKKFDQNGDGNVTAEELPNKQAFDRFDTNKDGVITAEEYAAADGGTKAQPSTPPAKPGDTPVSTPPAAMERHPDLRYRQMPGVDAEFHSLDKNQDAKVSRAEAEARGGGHWLNWFPLLDKDKDGFVTLGEQSASSTSIP